MNIIKGVYIMKCPKCGTGNARYKEQKKREKIPGGERFYKRTSNIVICKKCGYEGEL